MSSNKSSKDFIEREKLEAINVLDMICSLIKQGNKKNKKVKNINYWNDIVSKKQKKKQLGGLNGKTLKKYAIKIGANGFDNFFNIIDEYYQILQSTELSVKGLIDLIAKYLSLKEKKEFTSFVWDSLNDDAGQEK